MGIIAAILWTILAILFAAMGWDAAKGTKGQWVRIVDVLLFGPYLIYVSLHPSYQFSVLEQVFVLFLGTTTVTYNLRNYLLSR